MTAAEAWNAGKGHLRGFMIRQVEATGNAEDVYLFLDPKQAQRPDLTWRDVGEAEIVVHDKIDDWHNVRIFPEMVPILAEMQRGPDDALVFPQHDPRWWGELLVRITEPLPVFGAIGRRVGSQWHLLRSTWAVNRARGIGLDSPATLWKLMAWGGWKIPTTPMRYINVARAAGMV